jgi:ABC-type multidrug transport system ATPase subunit
MMAANVLEADSIVVNYRGVSLLSNVYVRCDQGQVVGLLGRNGCGKSTLLNVIFGSKEPEQKSIRINGQYINKGYEKSRITLLPQSALIPSNLRIREVLKLFGVKTSLLERTFPESLNYLDQNPGKFSGGELRFLELILILYSGSQFCLLDEPFSGLSPVMVERAIDLMNEVKQQKGILITDHLYRRVIACADRLYYLSNRSVFQIENEEQLARLGYVPV